MHTMCLKHSMGKYDFRFQNEPGQAENFVQTSWVV